MKTLKQWIDFYERKSGDRFKQKPNATFLFDSEKGFIQYSIVDDFHGERVLLIDETVGNGRYWESEALIIAKENGCTKLVTVIYRDPNVYQKRFPKTHIMAYVMTEEVI